MLLTNLSFNKIYHITGDYKLMVNMNMFDNDGIARYNISIHNTRKNTCCSSMSFDINRAINDNKIYILPVEDVEDFKLDLNLETFELVVHSDKYYIDDTIHLGLKEVSL